MTPIVRSGKFYLYVPRQSGGVVLRTTGTSDAKVYRGMKRMLAELKDTRRWAVLNAVADKRLTLGAVYDAHSARALEALEASLSARALGPLVADYLQACRSRGLAPRNVDNITRQLQAFGEYVKGGTTADLTPAVVMAWLGTLTVSPGTRRQYLFAVTGLTRYLVDVDVLADYPLSRVKAPKKNAARMRYESAENDERIVRAARSDVRGLFAFIKGTGVDVSVALTTLARDIDLGAGTARLKGTKTAQRDVHGALVESWAVPYVKAALSGVLPNVAPWGHLTRYLAQKQHAAACEAVGIVGYTLRDARHSVAVRMGEQGYSVFEIAEQLGNSPELVAQVYGRHIVRLTRKAATTEASNDAVSR